MNKNYKKPRVSKTKYELTLAEFPLFLLSKGGTGKTNEIRSIEYQDTISGKNGKLVDREWKVYPDGKLGFGTASTLTTLFQLFQIWKQVSFHDQYIQFGSVYSLIKSRGLGRSKQQYNQLAKDLNCLVGMRIEAKNAFWDNELKAYVDMSFHLFDEVYLYKEKANGQASLPFARIKASDVLYGSIQKNSILTTNFDTEFFYSLTPLEQRLALYLSKVLKSQSTHKRGLLTFASQLPIYAKQTKHIKQNIKRGCSGLIKKGFDMLHDFALEKGADGKTEMVVFHRKGDLPLPFKSEKYKDKKTPANAPFEIEALLADIKEVCPKDEKSEAFFKKVATYVPRTIIYRVLSEVRQTSQAGDIKKSEGALFTNLIKRQAKEQNIDI